MLNIKFQAVAASERKTGGAVRGRIRQEVIWNIGNADEQEWAAHPLLVLRTLPCGLSLCVRKDEAGASVDGKYRLFNENLRPQVEQAIASLDAMATQAAIGGHDFSFTVLQGRIGLCRGRSLPDALSAH